MCKTHDFIQNQKSYNWDGDRIIYNTTISNTRSIASSRKKYDIDVRELLLSEHNSVIREAIEKIKNELTQPLYVKFNEKKEGSFDFKMRVVTEFVEQIIKYKERPSFDAWLFPDETLSLGQGDCEDRAILIATLASAVGVSSYNLRVSLGHLVTEEGKFSHAWVMYKNEKGVWQIIEPNDYKTRSGKDILGIPEGAYYLPSFVFNVDHLWGVYNGENIEELGNADCFSNYLGEALGKTYNPSFGGAVHKAIVLKAFEGIEETFKDCLTKEMKSDLVAIPIFNSAVHYVNRLAAKINAVDLTLKYNALDHFDNSQIDNSMKAMVAHLNDGTIGGLAKGLHALQDFYAHTSYAHFAPRDVAGNIKPANISIRGFEITLEANIGLPVYDGTGLHPFNFKNFTVNNALFKDTNGNALTPEAAISFWKGKIISGRFGQRKDSHALLEMTQFVDETLPNLNMAAGVPHHEDIAVDDNKKPDSKNKLYNNHTEYSQQFEQRKNAAINHTRHIVLEWIALRQ